MRPFSAHAHDVGAAPVVRDDTVTLCAECVAGLRPAPTYQVTRELELAWHAEAELARRLAETPVRDRIRTVAAKNLIAAGASRIRIIGPEGALLDELTVE